MRSLYPTFGGMALANHKPMITPIIQSSLLPKQLIYPLFYRHSWLTPLVKIGQRVLKYQPLTMTNSLAIPPIHAASSGIIKAIQRMPMAHPSNLTVNSIVIETDGEDKAIELDKINLHEFTKKDCIQRIHQAGIIGLGGGGFSTAIKMSGDYQLDYLIINAVECEPYLNCDDALIQQYAETIVTTVALLLRIWQIPTAMIAIEEDKLLAYSQLIMVAKIYPQIEIVLIPAIYPNGYEKRLIQQLTGRIIPSQGIPPQFGILCINVATVFAIYQALYLAQPLIDRVVSITGEAIKFPKNVRVLIGTSIEELMNQLNEDLTQINITIGGSMTGFNLENKIAPIMKTTQGILLMPKAKIIPQPMACIRCGECANVCPAQLLPQQLYRYSSPFDLANLQAHYLSACIECRCCDSVCPSQIPLVNYFRTAKHKIIMKDLQQQQAILAKQRYQAKQLRQQQQLEIQAERLKKQKLELAALKAKIATKKKVTD